MATKRSLLDFGVHGKQVWENMGPAGKRRKVREYFTARGKPDDYQYTPEESREATNYLKAVDRYHSGDAFWSNIPKGTVGGGSSFLQGAASDVSDNYKDPIQEFDYPKFLAEQDSETLEEEEISKITAEDWADSQELGGDLHDIGNRGERIDEMPSLLDYDPDQEAYDSEEPDSTGGFASTFSSGKGGKLSPMQKYGAKLIMDTFGEKEERPMQVASVVPLTPGRALDMSRYSSARPKRERYRNMGLLGRA